MDATYAINVLNIAKLAEDSYGLSRQISEKAPRCCPASFIKHTVAVTDVVRCAVSSRSLRGFIQFHSTDSLLLGTSQ